MKDLKDHDTLLHEIKDGLYLIPSVADPLIDYVTTSFASPRADRLPIHDRGSGTEGKLFRNMGQEFESGKSNGGHQVS